MNKDNKKIDYSGDITDIITLDYTLAEYDPESSEENDYIIIQIPVSIDSDAPTMLESVARIEFEIGHSEPYEEYKVYSNRYDVYTYNPSITIKKTVVPNYVFDQAMIDYMLVVTRSEERRVGKEC